MPRAFDEATLKDKEIRMVRRNKFFIIE
jgi:hypothetical protein